jgi:hypothetical protein
MPRLALFLVLCLAATVAHAQNPIRRCVDANGRQVFTDQPCASVQATDAVAPATPVAAAGLTSTVPVLCAATRAELRQAIVDAFAARDANRLAGLILWNGGSAGTVADIRTLNSLTRQPLLDFGDAQADDEAPASDLRVHTGMAGAAQETHFGIVRHAGCLWLTPPG